MDRIDDSKWPEVKMINGYATFVGVLMLAVRGLGVLLITWITVVLLGGFVSDLEKKDFWCLTMITLVQTAGVFNSLLEEKAGDIVNSFSASVLAFIAIALSMRPLHNYIKLCARDASNIYLLIAWKALSAAVGVVWFLLYLVSVFLGMAHWVVLGVIYCPIAALYLFGIYVSTGISIWRLKHQDYGDGDGKASLLKPALNILYVLAAAQGVCYCYKTIHRFAARPGLAKEVAKEYQLVPELVSLYIMETTNGCLKDSSFSRGRNLVTYGVDLLLESKSPGHASRGVQILAKILPLRHRLEVLTALPSFKELIQRLLETLDPRSGYGLETRKHAATVVKIVAHRICLDQFPGGIRFISSLLYHEHSSMAMDRDIDRYKGLTKSGLSILEELTLYEDNCIVIRNTEGVVSKIMGPLISEQFHSVHHDDERHSMLKTLMQLMRRLMDPPEEAGTSSNNMAIISNLKSIVECRECEVMLKREAVEMLLRHLPVDRSSIMINRSSSRIVFLGILVHIFLLADGSNHSVRKGSNVRRLAGENMQAVLSPQSGPSSMLESVRVVVSSLARAVADARDSSAHCRVPAAHILVRLCDDYHLKLDEYLVELAKAVVALMCKALLSLKVQFSASSSQQQQHGGGGGEQQHEDRELQEALIFLCRKARSRWTRRDRDFNVWLDEITAKTCSEQGMLMIPVAVKTFYDLVSDTETHLKKAQRLAGAAAATSSS